MTLLTNAELDCEPGDGPLTFSVPKKNGLTLWYIHVSANEKSKWSPLYYALFILIEQPESHEIKDHIQEYQNTPLQNIN